MRWPGVEPGSIAWKATMLTATPPTRCLQNSVWRHCDSVMIRTTTRWQRRLQHRPLDGECRPWIFLPARHNTNSTEAPTTWEFLRHTFRTWQRSAHLVPHGRITDKRHISSNRERESSSDGASRILRRKDSSTSNNNNNLNAKRIYSISIHSSIRFISIHGSH